MRERIAYALLVSVLLSLSGCMGYEKGNGISRLDTISPEDKAEEKWFKSFYGKNHCHGQWASDCEDEESSGGTGEGI